MYVVVLYVLSFVTVKSLWFAYIESLTDFVAIEYFALYDAFVLWYRNCSEVVASIQPKICSV